MRRVAGVRLTWCSLSLAEHVVANCLERQDRHNGKDDAVDGHPGKALHRHPTIRGTIRYSPAGRPSLLSHAWAAIIPSVSLGRPYSTPVKNVGPMGLFVFLFRISIVYTGWSPGDRGLWVLWVWDERDEFSGRVVTSPEILASDPT